MREWITGIVLIVEGSGASAERWGFGWEERCLPNIFDVKVLKFA